MAKITDPDNLFYSEYTYTSAIDPTIALDGGPANMLIDYQNRRFALTAPKYGIIGAGVSEMVGYGATGGVSGQALYSKFKNIWKTDPIAIRFPFPMEAITPESFEFINGWLPDDDTTDTANSSTFITRKLIKDTGWAERSAVGNIQRKYFGAITLGQITLGPTGFSTVYYNSTDPGIQTSFTIDTDGSVDTTLDRIVFDTVVGNGNTYSSAPYFYTGDPVVYQTDGTTAITGLTHNDIYYIHYTPGGTVPVGAGHSFSLHTNRDDALSGINSVSLTGSTAAEVVTFTSASLPEDFFFGVTEEGSSANEPFQFYATANDDGTNILYDKTDYFKIFAREEAKTYSDQTLAQIGVSELNYQAYRLPLATGSDPNVTILDAGASGIATAGYSGIGISFYQTPQSFTIGQNSYDFNVVINADSQPLQIVYSKIQYLLRQNNRVLAGASADGNVNSLTGTDFLNDFRLGATQQPLLEFVGNDLYVRKASDVFGESGGPNYGIFINNVRNEDLNSVYFYDQDGTTSIFYPFLAQGNFVFNENFTGDSDSRFWVFYDEDDQGAVPGLSTSLNHDAGTIDTTDGVINSGTDSAAFVVGAGNSHPFVMGQRVVAIGTAADVGIGITCELTFTQSPSFSYYVNALNIVGAAQTYSDITESGTNTPASTNNRIGIGQTDVFRLHNTYAEAVANNYAGINTIQLTASGNAGVVTFRQVDVNFSETNATILQDNDGIYLDAQLISGASVEFTYDYDNNSQRNRIPAAGADPSGTYSPKVRVVAVGLQTGQYASATASISRSKGQTINVTGALERVYNDPA